MRHAPNCQRHLFTRPPWDTPCTPPFPAVVRIAHSTRLFASMAARVPALPTLESPARLSPRVIRVLGDNPGPFTLQGTNTYLVGTGASRLLIDTGQGGIPSWTAALRQVLLAERATVGTCLVSHCHPDHVGGVWDLWSVCPGAVVRKAVRPEREADERESGSWLPALRWENGAGNGVWRSGQEQAQEEEKRRKAVASGKVATIVDGQRFSVEGATLVAVSSPGHTTDHMVFVLEEEDAMFTADNVLGHGTSVFEDLAAYVGSLQLMKGLFGGRAYPGHGAVIEHGPRKIMEYLEHRQERENGVVKILGMPRLDSRQRQKKLGWDTRELVEVIYAQSPKEVWPAAERGIMLILTKLLKEGKVMQNEDGSWIVVTKAVL